MGMFDDIIIKREIQLPDELKSLNIDWKNHKFQTKDLDNCLLEYFINEEGFLYEHVVERNYIAYTKEERKTKKIKPWDLWKEVIEKETYDKKIENYHGKIVFYTYDKYDENNDFWLEYDAYFVYGKLDKIELKEFKKQKSRTICNQEFINEYKKKQKHPWNIFKKYASYIGWSWFWKQISKIFYKISVLSSKIQAFINNFFI